MSARTDMLRAKAREILPDLKRAREATEKADAENRPLTAEEKAVYDAAMTKARPILDALERARNDETAMAGIRALAAEVGNPFGGAGATGAKTGQRLAFKGMAVGVAGKMLGGGEGFGVKALAPSGAAVVAQGFTADPIALGRPATGLLDILPVRVQASAEYAYLRQNTRDTAAAVVDEGDLKPTTELGIQRVEASLAVIAHLSEGIPRYWLADTGALEQFVGAELEYGLRQAVEAKVIADVNDSSGIQTQAWSTSVIETIRKALTKVEVAGHTPGAIVLHPSDFEAVELGVASTTAVAYQGLPYDAAARRLFGVPIATTVSASAGVGHVIAIDAVALDTDSQGVSIAWSETSNSDDFARNLIRCRVEGRYGTSVLSPLGVVIATLAD